MKNNSFKKFKDYMTYGSTRQGNTAVITIVIIVAIIILLNLLVGQLPENVRMFDFSSQKIYEITDTSRQYLSGLKDDINIYMLSSSSETDKRIRKFVSNYAELSDHITAQEINTLESPSYLSKYECNSDSLVVECPATGKYTAISYTGDADALILTTTGYDSSYSVTTTETAFDAEGQITSAIDYVTGTVSEKVYVLTGHGETEVASKVSERIVKANVAISETPVDLLKDGAVPEDCSLLLCYNPQTDLAEDELSVLRDYMASGKNMFIVINDSELSNFNALLSDYGMEMAAGYVGDQSRYLEQYSYQYGYFFFYPSFVIDSDITADINGNSVILYSRGMTLGQPVRDSIEVSPFLVTTDKAIAVVDDTNYTAGQFAMGAAATEETENGTSRLTVITALSFLDDGVTTRFPGASNLDVFSNAFAANFDNVSNFTIASKSLQTPYNTITNFGFFSIMFIIIIPLAIIIGGLATWLRRRKL